jgi:hypothetical protein
MDFATYARWKMPKLDLPELIDDSDDDPSDINSRGVETAPIALAEGQVLYFTARLRPPAAPNEAWIGAARAGAESTIGSGPSFDRPYRTELGEQGWTVPQLVVIPGVEPDRHIKVTWVASDELRCYVTVSGTDEAPWVGESRRSSAIASWGDVERLPGTDGGDAFDAAAMAGGSATTVFASTRTGNGDLYLYDPERGEAHPLQPEINTRALEWAARIGPNNELYFVRGDRQLRFRDGSVGEVRFQGLHRSLITEAVPTSDGRWLFFAAPKLRPIEFDFDIMVAPIGPDGSLGSPMDVDSWRPN